MIALPGMLRRWIDARDGEGRTSQWIFLLGSPLVLAVLVASAHLPLMERLENLTVDLRFRWRAKQDPKADARLLFVAIDESSLERFGRWPWPRNVHGDFCKLLGLAEPSVVAFDLLFTESSDPAEDAHFAAAIPDLREVITGALSDADTQGLSGPAGRTLPLQNIIGDRRAVPGKAGAKVPAPALAESAWFGFVDSEPTSSDGIRRRAPMLIRIGEAIYPSLALQSLLRFWNAPPDGVEVRLGHWIQVPVQGGDPVRIPINAAGELWINYRANGSFASWSYERLMRALYSDALEEAPFPPAAPHPKGRIVVVGQAAVGLTDLGPSPLEAQSPLALTWLNALNTILRRDYLHVVPFEGWYLLGWLAVAWGTVAPLRRERASHALALPAFIIAAYIAVAWSLMAWNSVVLPVAVPVMGFALVHVGAVAVRWVEERIARREVSAELERTAEAKKRLEQELEIAREIQMSTLPAVFPPFPDRPEIDLHAYMEAAKSVGGDLFEFFFIDDHRLFFVVGDVAGKGVPAALFMTMTLAVIRAHAVAGRSPAETLRRSNNVLAMRNESSTFATVFCGILDTRTGEVRYSNGGHNPPIVLNGEGGLRFLEEGGTAIGAIEGLDYTDLDMKLEPGQGLLLYTDGVTEAFNSAQEAFGEERLADAMRVRHRTLGAQRLTERIRVELTKFVAGAEQSDDITVLAMLYLGPPDAGEGGVDSSGSAN